MIATIPLERTANDSVVRALFENKPPVLVEVRFPHMAASPDWYLCQDQSDLDFLRERLGPGVELHLNSVWDLKNPGKTVLLANG